MEDDREGKRVVLTRRFSPIAQGSDYAHLLRESFVPEILDEIENLRQAAGGGDIELFHVVGDEWKSGEDLQCIATLREQGRFVEQVATVKEHDADVISLCWTQDEAEKWRDEYGPRRRILRLRIPVSVEFTSTNEGNPAIAGTISTQYIVEVIPPGPS